MSELTHAGGRGEPYCDTRIELPKETPCRFCGNEHGAHDGTCFLFHYSLHAGNRRGLMDEVIKRCRENDQKHGGPAHDDTHSPMDWVSFIEHWNSKAAAWQAGQPVAFTPDFRSRMIDVAALAIAAIESYDRKQRR